MNKFKKGENEPRSKLPREIWRWLLGFSLIGKIKNVRRDFSNGYVIAEVLHHYYPKGNEITWLILLLWVILTQRGTRDIDLSQISNFQNIGMEIVYQLKWPTGNNLNYFSKNKQNIENFARYDESFVIWYVWIIVYNG